ncbi:NADP-dependent oxidoreductase, partial [Staphylococcus haemolyticus]
MYVSVDPYRRGRMTDTKSYVQPFQVNEPLQGHSVGKVTQSNDERLSVGDYVTGIFPWTPINTVNGDDVTPVPSKDV